MKRFLVTILAFLYITTSTGATVHIHYCMGHLASWGIGEDKSKKCGKCGMKKAKENKKGCCKDEKKFYKNTSDQKTSAAVKYSMQGLSAILPVGPAQKANALLPIINSVRPIIHGPPKGTSVPVYIFDQSFLI